MAPCSFVRRSGRAATLTLWSLGVGCRVSNPAFGPGNETGHDSDGSTDGESTLSPADTEDDDDDGGDGDGDGDNDDDDDDDDDDDSGADDDDDDDDSVTGDDESFAAVAECVPPRLEAGLVDAVFDYHVHLTDVPEGAMPSAVSVAIPGLYSAVAVVGVSLNGTGTTHAAWTTGQEVGARVEQPLVTGDRLTLHLRVNTPTTGSTAAAWPATVNDLGASKSVNARSGDADGDPSNGNTWSLETVEPALDRLYWIGLYGDAIKRSELDGSNAVTLVNGGLDDAVNLAMDFATDSMYWSDYGNVGIWRASLDGQGVTRILGPADGLVRPVGLAFDAATQMLYWTDHALHYIARAHRDGGEVEILIDSGLYAPNSVALDRINRRLYFTEEQGDRVSVAGLDGSSPTVLVNYTQGVNWPSGVLPVPQFNELYWLDAIPTTLRRMPLSGGPITTLYDGPNDNDPRAVAVDTRTGQIYWSDLVGDSISRCEHDGSGRVNVLSLPNEGPRGLVFGP